MADLTASEQRYRDAATRSLDAMHERATQAEAERDRYRLALEKIVALNMPYRDTANRARDLARKALSDV